MGKICEKHSTHRDPYLTELQKNRPNPLQTDMSSDDLQPHFNGHRFSSEAGEYPESIYEI